MKFSEHIEKLRSGEKSIGLNYVKGLGSFWPSCGDDDLPGEVGDEVWTRYTRFHKLKSFAAGSLLFMVFLGTIFGQEGSHEMHGSTNRMASQESKDCPAPGPTFSMEYLYWKVDAELYAGLLLTRVQDDTGAVTEKSRLKRQKFDFTSGFRAGLGYDLPYEHYDLSLAWTWLQPKTTTTFSTQITTDNNAKVAIALELTGETGEDIPGMVGSLSSKWHMRFNMLDLQMGRKFFVGKHFSLRPNLGMKGGWINQTQKFSFNDVPIKDNNGDHAPNTQGSGKKTNKFAGVGPLIGIDMRYGFGPEFGLFGNLSGALLYGHFNLTNKFFLGNNGDINTPTTVDPLTVTLQNSHSRLSPMVQMLIGGDWLRCLYQKWMIRLGAAYEVQFWSDQLGTNDSFGQVLTVTYRSGGDLMMHGLTLQARIDF